MEFLKEAKFMDKCTHEVREYRDSFIFKGRFATSITISSKSGRLLSSCQTLQHVLQLSKEFKFYIFHILNFFFYALQNFHFFRHFIF